MPPSLKTALVVAAGLAITACSAGRPEAGPRIGMPNPASAYCVKLGGKLEIIHAAAGEQGLCTLPGGERIEEWTLFRKDHPARSQAPT